MVLEQEFAHAIQDLVKQSHAMMTIGESHIHMHISEATKKISLMTNVYKGENYIPDSVRQAMSYVSPFARRIHTSLRLDEPSFAIELRYLGDLELLSKKQFRLLLEEFASIADEWRAYFDDHDKKDRIHVRKPK